MSIPMTSSAPFPSTSEAAFVSTEQGSSSMGQREITVLSQPNAVMQLVFDSNETPSVFESSFLPIQDVLSKGLIEDIFRGFFS